MCKCCRCMVWPAVRSLDIVVANDPLIAGLTAGLQLGPVANVVFVHAPLDESIYAVLGLLLALSFEGGAGVELGDQTRRDFVLNLDLIVEPAELR